MIFSLSNTRSLQYLATRCNLLLLRSLRVVQDFGAETSAMFMGRSLLRVQNSITFIARISPGIAQQSRKTLGSAKLAHASLAQKG